MMDLQSLRTRKTELMEALKEASINIERIRGALWFCDELIVKLEGNGLAEVNPNERSVVEGTDPDEGKAV